MSETPRVPLDDLIANLHDQIAGYERLTVIANRELDGLIGGQSEDLSELLAAQEREIVELHRLERGRLAALAPVAETLQRDPTEVRLRDLEELVPAETAHVLTALRERLTGQIATLREVNGRNSRLLHSALMVILRWRAIMTSGIAPNATYSREGTRAAPGGAWRLDQAV